MLDNVPSDIIKNIENYLLKFVKHRREYSYLLGNELWDDNFTNHITTELWCFQLKKHIFFETTNEIEGCRKIFESSTDWELSPHVEIIWPYTRNKRVT